MIATDYIFGKNKKNSSPAIEIRGGLSHLPVTTGAILGFSFRQLVPTATKSIRQYKNPDKVEFQDVGFIDGYIDYNSIIAFANGTTTYYEQYNQFDNTLRYVKLSTAQLPFITVLGQLNIVNKNIGGLFTSSGRLRAEGFNFGSNVATFQVSDGANESNTSYMMNSGPWGWTGVMTPTETSSAFSGGGWSITTWKNKAQITPINRQILYNQLVPFHTQHTIRNLNYNGAAYLIKGYNIVAAQFSPLKYSQEELWYNQALLTTAQISDIEQNQIDYHL